MRNSALSYLFLFLIFFPVGATAQDGKAAGAKTGASAVDLKNKGIGPVKNVKVGPLDKELAEKGEKLFESKCTACHKLEQRYVGPALSGVTTRRSPEWIMNMILNPGEMVQKDPIAKELLAQYNIPMTFQNLTQDDARAVLEYFREEDQKAPKAGATGAEPPTKQRKKLPGT